MFKSAVDIKIIAYNSLVICVKFTTLEMCYFRYN
jgi:hypothetical protein